MPATSKIQRKLFGIALSIKSGKLPCSYSKSACRISRQMSEEDIRDFAKTSEKRLPKKRGELGRIGKRTRGR